MNTKSLYEQAATALDQAKALLAEHEDDLTPEIEEQVDGLMRRADELKARADKFIAIEERDGELKVSGIWNQKPEPVAPTRPAQVRQEPEKFKSFGEQMAAVMRASVPGGVVDRRLVRDFDGKATGLSEGIASDGGFLVQTDFATELLRRMYEVGQVSRLARRLPIGANSNGIKINAISETSRATGSRWGGVRGYWVAEAGTKTASTPEFRQMELNLKKLAGLCYATDELLADTTALEALLREAFAEEFAWLVDDAMINGTGAGQPLGILAAPCLVSVAAEVGQAATTFVFENAVKMWSRLWSPSRRNAVWFINQDVEPQLQQMSIPVGTGGMPVYLPPGGLSQAPYSTLFGRPVVPIEQCPTLGTVGDVILADMSQYLMIEKGPMDAASSIHVRFIYDETTFRFVYRVDGQPAWHSALTPASGSANTLSPFVVLATRS